MEKISFKSVDNDEEVTFSVIDKTEVSNQMYLLVCEGDYDQNSDIECYIMKASSIDKDEVNFIVLEDEDEIRLIAEIFEDRTDEILEF